MIRENVRCLLKKMLLVDEGMGQAGEVGERGSMVSKVDREKPCSEGKLPLSLSYI